MTQKSWKCIYQTKKNTIFAIVWKSDLESYFYWWCYWHKDKLSKMFTTHITLKIYISKFSNNVL